LTQIIGNFPKEMEMMFCFFEDSLSLEMNQSISSMEFSQETEKYIQKIKPEKNQNIRTKTKK